MLNDAETKELMNRQFDLLILDGAFPECAVGLAYLFKAPFMYINTVGFYMGSISLAGSPAPFSITPVLHKSFTDDMNLLDRAMNTGIQIFMKIFHRVSIKVNKFTLKKKSACQEHIRQFFILII